MADQKDTETVVEPKDQTELKKLRSEVKRLEGELSSEKSLRATLASESGKRLDELEKQLAQKPSVLDLSIGSTVVVNGKTLKVVDVDLSWEVGEKVAKSLVDEDALCLVLG